MSTHLTQTFQTFTSESETQCHVQKARRKEGGGCACAHVCRTPDLIHKTSHLHSLLRSGPVFLRYYKTAAKSDLNKHKFSHQIARICEKSNKFFGISLKKIIVFVCHEVM
jgi:hypothetical protein